MQESLVRFLGRFNSWVRRFPGEGIGYPPQCSWASLVARLIKNLPTVQETWVQSLGWDNPLEKGKATHFSILAWRSSWGHKESDMTEWLSLSQGSRALGLSSFGFQALELKLNSCGTLAYLLHNMWDLPVSGMEPVPSVLAGGWILYHWSTRVTLSYLKLEDYTDCFLKIKWLCISRINLLLIHISGLLLILYLIVLHLRSWERYTVVFLSYNVLVRFWCHNYGPHDVVHFGGLFSRKDSLVGIFNSLSVWRICHWSLWAWHFMGRSLIQI